jgi:hypothetical protein
MKINFRYLILVLAIGGAIYMFVLIKRGFKQNVSALDSIYKSETFLTKTDSSFFADELLKEVEAIETDYSTSGRIVNSMALRNGAELRVIRIPFDSSSLKVKAVSSAVNQPVGVTYLSNSFSRNKLSISSDSIQTFKMVEFYSDGERHLTQVSGITLCEFHSKILGYSFDGSKRYDAILNVNNENSKVCAIVKPTKHVLIIGFLIQEISVPQFDCGKIISFFIK